MINMNDFQGDHPMFRLKWQQWCQLCGNAVHRSQLAMHTEISFMERHERNCVDHFIECSVREGLHDQGHRRNVPREPNIPVELI